MAQFSPFCMDIYTYMFLNISFDLVHRWKAQLAELTAQRTWLDLHKLSTTNRFTVFRLSCSHASEKWLYVKFSGHLRLRSIFANGYVLRTDLRIMIFQFFVFLYPLMQSENIYFRLKMHRCPLDVLEFLDM